MLNCIVSFEKLAESNKCGSDSNAIISTVARKMTADVAPSIINNAYFKPSYRNPYYTIEQMSGAIELYSRIGTEYEPNTVFVFQVVDENVVIELESSW